MRSLKPLPFNGFSLLAEFNLVFLGLLLFRSSRQLTGVS